ncbi:MAG: hypothetical protein CL893_01080 [Dehalococcoidia bacterium]|nr:hypothetical protein [Dehalococcoidia bacterium]|tara:strand:+ start:6256 stop:7494 length:1239 start_codon:yes stop_codon:yes gene_type:complete
MGKRRKKKFYTGPNLTEQHNFYTDQKLTVLIEKYDSNGVGVGFYKDIPIVVFNSIIGEEIEVSIEKIFPEKIIGKNIKVNTLSEKRTKIDCEFFGNCTGCQWMHINYPDQLTMKRDIVINHLSNNNLLIENIVQKTIPSEKKIHYRNHARFTVRKKNLKEEIGFVNFLNRQWTNINQCKIMNKTINSKMESLRNNLEGKTQVSIRASDITKSFLIQPKFENLELDTGQKYYKEKIFDNTYQVASPSFFQVNISQVEKIFKKLIESDVFSSNQLAVDAYCGVGTFTCLIAPYVNKVYGIEESASAIIDAKENSKKYSNIEYLLGKTEEVLSDVKENIDLLILDPPRIGCDDKVIEIINKIKPKDILLISCSPENFAVDISKLVSISYEVKKIIPFDMFPQTHHVEVVGVLNLL